MTAFADAVIVAAGASRRMAGADKLELELNGWPMLRWSVEAMAAAQSVARVIVVARAERVDALSREPWLREATIVAGGAERSDSVRAGASAATAAVLLVHDGARPFASATLVDAVAAAAAEHGAAVPVVPLVDSLKRASGAVLGEAVVRDGLVRTQTPQGARRELLLAAFETAAGRSFSDEAALLAHAGVKIATVPGEAANIKVTEPADVEIARAIAAARRGSSDGDLRFGFGQDTHGFGPGDGLWLGGVLFEQAPRLHGHSDGDVVLHALATAILAACGMGDLGRAFPPSDRATEGIASRVMLEHVLKQVESAGWQLSRVQVAITGARPRFGTRLDEIRAAIGPLVGLPEDSVSVTASTGNLNGAEGAGRVISATALISVHRR